MQDDRERIEEMHQTDMRASMARDYATLRTLMSDDAVVLPPNGRVVRGRATIDAGFERMQGVELPSEVLEYRFDWQELTVLGDYAFEWGYIYGRERERATGEVTEHKHHVMRILRKEPDGAWKVHRTIWNDAAK